MWSLCMWLLLEIRESRLTDLYHIIYLLVHSLFYSLWFFTHTHNTLVWPVPCCSAKFPTVVHVIYSWMAEWWISEKPQTAGGESTKLHCVAEWDWNCCWLWPEQQQQQQQPHPLAHCSLLCHSGADRLAPLCIVNCTWPQSFTYSLIITTIACKSSAQTWHPMY